MPSHGRTARRFAVPMRRSGHCCTGTWRCIPPFGCNRDKAQELLTKIRVPLTSNPIIRGMLPTLARCIAAVNDNPHKCRYQLCEGQKTGIQW